MAHNINEENGKHSFFSVNEKAWHGLGQIVDQNTPQAQRRYSMQAWITLWRNAPCLPTV